MLQFQELVVAPRIVVLSLPFLALNWVNQALWLSWALLVGEQSITMVASTMGVLMGLDLAVGPISESGASYALDSLCCRPDRSLALITCLHFQVSAMYRGRKSPPELLRLGRW